MRYLHCHCDATGIVPNKHAKQPWKARAVLYSGTGVSCISEKMVAELRAYFEGTQIVYLTRRTTKDRVADVWELAI